MLVDVGGPRDTGPAEDPPGPSAGLVRAGAWSLAGRVGVAVTGLVTSALLTRLVAPAELGTYLIALSVVSVGALLGGLGVNQVVVRFVGESVGTGTPARAWQVVRVGSWFTAGGSLAAAVAYLMAGHVLAREVFGSPMLAAIVPLVAMWILAVTGQNYVTEVLRGFGDIRGAALCGGLAQGLLLAGALAAALLLAVPVAVPSVVLLALAASAVVTAAAAGLLRRRARAAAGATSVEPAVAVRDLPRVAAPLLGAGCLLLLLAQVDLWIVAALLPQSEVATYGTAARVASLVGMPLLIVNGVLPPLLSRLRVQRRTAELERLLRAAALLAAAPALLVTGLFVAAGGPLLRLIYGEYYAEGALVLAVLALGQLVSVLTGSCGLTLALSGRQAQLFAVTAVGGVFTVGALAVLTPRYGTSGAASAAAGGLAVQNVLMLLAARRTTGMWTYPSLAGLPVLLRSVGPGRRTVGGLR